MDDSAIDDSAIDDSAIDDSADNGTADIATFGDEAPGEEEPVEDLPSEGEPAFRDLGLHPALVEAVEALGYEQPTPIQAAAIPVMLEGGDVLGLAATGTGKTAAFTLPMLHRMATSDRAPDGRPRGLVLVPTRELARQVGRAVRRYGQRLAVRVLEVYGGASIGYQWKQLQRGVDVVVGTPGRVLDHLRRDNVDLGAVEVVVLDEADEMLDMGFQDDLEAILHATPGGHQTALFSATFPPRLVDVARRHLHQPARIEALPSSEQERPDIREVLHVVPRRLKAAALARTLILESPEAALVFCRTRADVDELARLLDAEGTRVEALHGGMGQAERDRVVARLREGTASLVVATDVAARGLDIDRLTHVVNFDVPEVAEQYVHRIGRTGRAGRSGVAITLAEPRDRRRVHAIEALTGRRLPVEPVPSADDLRTARLERLAERVLEAVTADSDALDPYRAVAAELSEALDPVDVAAAALQALAIASGEHQSEVEQIPDEAFAILRRQPGRSRHPRSHGGAGPGSDAGGRPRGGWTRLYISAGRDAGVRPGDLVGAIAGETGLSGRAVGAIRISSGYSLVDVPSTEADRVIRALSRTKIRGRKVKVRRDRAAHGR
ncbi:MAG: DEAD/DEAH box helicase [Deltaproteobacteria bacterium]|nr:MAG: DEAD/DEAH box helicase [Deltaproteobacteria bacterium]